MTSIALGADKADKVSLALDIASSRTSNISQADSGEAVSISSLFSPPMDLYGKKYTFNFFELGLFVELSQAKAMKKEEERKTTALLCFDGGT